MSALLTNLDLATPSPREQSRPQLRALPTHQGRLATVPFIVLLVTLMGLGMAGILLLNVRIQQRAQVVGDLQEQAQQLGYQQAALTSEVQHLRSATSLQTKAWQMGMRPNAHPAFLVLPEGRIVGEPTRVSGNELGDQKYRPADEVAKSIDAANKAAKERKRLAAEKARKDREALIAKQKADRAAQAKRQTAEAAAKKKAAAAKQQAAAVKKPAATAKPATTAKKPTGGR